MLELHGDMTDAATESLRKIKAALAADGGIEIFGLPRFEYQRAEKSLAITVELTLHVPATDRPSKDFQAIEVETPAL